MWEVPDERLGGKRTHQHLESLALKHALGVLDNTLDTARIKHMTHREIAGATAERGR